MRGSNTKVDGGKVSVLWHDTVLTLVEKAMFNYLLKDVELSLRRYIKAGYRNRLNMLYSEVSLQHDLKPSKVAEAEHIIKAEKTYWKGRSLDSIMDELAEDRAFKCLQTLHDGVKSGKLNLDLTTRRKIVFEANKVKPYNEDRKKKICHEINRIYRQQKEAKAETEKADVSISVAMPVSAGM